MRKTVQEIIAGLFVGLLAAFIIIGADALFSNLQGGTAADTFKFSPGGSVTGFAFAEFPMFGKLLEVLKEVAPAASRIANW